MKLNRDDVLHVAKLARVALTDDEIETFSTQLTEIISHFDVLNAVGIDWATFGNHEFDVPEAAFHRRMSEQKFKLVSSNVTDANGYSFQGTVRSAVLPIRTRSRDLRIGLIGLTIDSTKKPWVKYLPPIDSARTEIATSVASVRPGMGVSPSASVAPPQRPVGYPKAYRLYDARTQVIGNFPDGRSPSPSRTRDTPLPTLKASVLATGRGRARPWRPPGE